MKLIDYEAADSTLTPQDYADALFVQSACNLSGVARSFALKTEKLWAESNSKAKGTEWVNHHPISLLFCHQMCFLTGRENFSDGIGLTYGEAHGYCTDRSQSVTVKDS